MQEALHAVLRVMYGIIHWAPGCAPKAMALCLSVAALSGCIDAQGMVRPGVHDPMTLAPTQPLEPPEAVPSAPERAASLFAPYLEPTASPHVWSPPERARLRVAVVSDMNDSYGSTSYSDHVHRAVEWMTDELRPDLIISTGDHVAGQRRGVNAPAMWRAFHEVVTEPIASAGIPFAPTAGNHDASAAAPFRIEREEYASQWSGRKPDVRFVDDSNYPFYYAFRMGPALFVGLDVTTSQKLGPRQRTWLEQVLMDTDAEVKVVFGHMPLFPFAERRTREILRDPRLEELFARHDVDAYLSGHHHAYYPGKRGDVRYVGMPCLGAGPRTLIGDHAPSSRSVVVLEIDPMGIASVEAYEGPEFTSIVPRHTLPVSLTHEGRHLWRDDVYDAQEMMLGMSD